MRIKALIIFIIFASVALASTAGTIAVQGFLTDNSSGREVPVNSTTCKIWVGFIDEADGSIDAENLYSSVKVVNGIFNLLVDMPGMSALDWNKPYKMRFAFNSEGGSTLASVLPDQKLFSVPYAFLTHRQEGGTVEAEYLSAQKTSSPYESARMGYRGTANEAVTGYIGTSAVGKLAIEENLISGTMYYGAYAEGRDYAIYAMSDGQGVVGGSQAPLDSFAAGITASGGIWGTSSSGISARILGYLKIASPLYMPFISPLGGTTTRLVAPGAKDKVTILNGTKEIRVNNPLVKSASSMVFLTIENVFSQKVWVSELGDGYFWIEKENTSGDMKVQYLVVN